MADKITCNKRPICYFLDNMTKRSSHDEEVIGQFTQQAQGYARLVSASSTNRIEALRQLLDIDPNDVVLDVACGPGTLALNLAPRVRSVTGVDLTPAMLEQARQAQQQQSLSNIEWRVANACALPFADSSFSLVICKAAFHHLQDPRRVFSEMTRVCRPGGRIAVIDVMPPADKTAAYDEIEKKRDSSHVHAHSGLELRALGENLPVSPPTLQVSMTPYLPLDAVLATSFPRDSTIAEIRADYEDAAHSPENRLGVRVKLVDGELSVSYPMATVIWHKQTG